MQGPLHLDDSCCPGSFALHGYSTLGLVQDGVAIAHATLQYLTEHLKPITLFVTHYPQVPPPPPPSSALDATYRLEHFSALLPHL